ncbi:hypothetical protein [Nocardia cyriacigeorgica]|uniref:hypothetical protein n=1 Tax=Nocardia cyriacigeorgica TaxID=135487 RepID=UPI0011B04D5B|nr:hypothetical protein [Nocardia cyriacigeorgica]
MRTTVDLSPDPMQAAKVAAAARGISLKELFSATDPLAHGSVTLLRVPPCYDPCGGMTPG